MVPRDNLVRANEVSTEKIMLNHSDINQKSETCDLYKKTIFDNQSPIIPDFLDIKSYSNATFMQFS